VSERGNALPEFAFAATLVVALLLGMLDFGRAVFDYHLVAQSARVGLRYAIVNSGLTAGQVQTFVRSQVPGIDSTQLTVTTTAPTASNCLTPPFKAGCTITVQSSYPFSFTSFTSLTAFTMTSTARMTISQ
jgi:Flp pilus assembly protein TadG